jgi:Tol biopolymer transport system component
VTGSESSHCGPSRRAAQRPAAIPTRRAVGSRQGRGRVALGAALLVTLAACRAGAGGPDAPPPSPTDRAVAVTGPRAYLYLVSLAGGAPRPLLSRAEADRLVSVSAPAWSPDGKLIAFTAGCPSCASKLYVVSSTGTGLRMIPTGPGGVSSPSWAPDGTAIVLTRQRGEQQFIVAAHLHIGRVWLVNGEPADADNFDSTPAWSPDGKSIVFAREIHHEDVTLWVVPAVGGKPRPLIRRDTAFDQSHPQWSPDGRRVVFMQSVLPSVTWDLFVFNRATRTVTQLTNDATNEYDPAWSPDGRSIVFAGDAASRAGFRSLYVIGADGSGLRRITASTTDDDSMPTWSPDGSVIIFVRRPIIKS